MSFVDDSPNTNHHSSDGKRREVIVMIHPDVHPYDIFIVSPFYYIFLGSITIFPMVSYTLPTQL